MIRTYVQSSIFINRCHESLPLRLCSVFYCTNKIPRRKDDPRVQAKVERRKIELFEPENPIDKTIRILKRDIVNFKNKWLTSKPTMIIPRYAGKCWTKDDDEQHFPQECDVLIIGGGAMGSSVAHHLKKRAGEGLKIVIVEKDFNYSKSSSALSVGGIRQQFSLEENIEMSLYGAEFIRNIDKHLGIPGDPPVDVQFRPNGYLFLASEQGAQEMIENAKLQRELGAKNILLKPEKLKERFPWISTEGVALACLGLEKEGWFDPWTYIFALKKKNLAQGNDYVEAEAVEFVFHNLTNMVYADENETQGDTSNNLIVETSDGKHRKIQFSLCIIAAGANSGEIAKLARIGNGPGILSIPLPVEPRKRFVYCFHSPDGPGINVPMTIDPSGTYFRREGLAGNFICGRCPAEGEVEPPVENLEVDHEFFERMVWPSLAHRVKSFENLKVQSSWAGYYEYNTYDQNGVIGIHPHYHNFYFATGFSGHGIQKSPAVGRAIAELILDSEFTTIDLTRLTFDRFVTLEPMRERNIV